ncbi:MAG TPA: TonB-dependent receptor [Bacteroidales bacterium]|nr:TonB-dependent receptor [Bacteroidales bacterium]
MKHLYRLITLFLLSVPVITHGQKVTLSGNIKDKNNGETLIGVSVFVKGTTTGIATNSYGFYSLSMNPGRYNVIIRYIGYETIDTVLNLQENRILNIEMIEQISQLQEVVVKAVRSEDNVTSTQMSKVTMSNKTIKQIPVSFGEADVIKTLVLLPGVKSADEGGSTLSVRGGGRDQNLIMLDEATVYNASHLGNLLSVFNNDAVQSIDFYKGNVPAQYGGRLSSVIDIRMKDGNNKRFSASGGIGTLSSRIALEGPINKGRGSYIISARRAYIDLLMKLMHAVNDTIPEIPYYFFDTNLKANYNLNQRNKIFLSGYFGKDVFEMNSEDNSFKNGFSWGNYTGTLRWNNIASDKIFTNLTLLVSNYNYSFDNEFTYGKPAKETKYAWDAFLLDYSAKYDLTYYLNEKNTIKTGLSSTMHKFNPGEVIGHDDTLKYNFAIPGNKALEHALYISNEWKLAPEITLEYGLRYSLFQNIGKATIYKLDETHSTIDTLEYKKGKVFNHFQSLEPRFAFTYLLDENSSIKAGYSRTSQFVHVASNSNTGSLIDIWVGSGPNIKPQMADLYSVGYFRNFLGNKIEASLEVYYKNMFNQIEFREFATPQFNERMDEDFRFGKGRSYGVELFVKKAEGKLTGWVSYSLSKTEKKIKDIQEKNWFLSTFDRPHDLSVVAMYNFSPKITFSANFQLKSGRPFTSPALGYQYDGTQIAYYPKRNNDRMPIYHRLDLSLTLNKSKPEKRFHRELIFSIFDVYNRNNPITIYFRPDEKDENITHAYKQSFLGFMPSVSWNFSF